MARIIALLLFLVSYKLLAQPVEIRGIVQDSLSGKLLPAVSVVIYRSQPDTSMVVFGLTNGQGACILRITQPGAYFIEVKALNYARSQHRLPGLSPGTSYTHVFRLAEAPTELNEVVVKPVTPVRVNGDTTSYRVKSFADGSERTVEDMLRKLPGVKIDEAGKITLNGKPIEKVLIEGEELFGKKYQLITRNVSAGLVEEVQAIDNYRDNPLLKGVDHSSQTVLNLRVNAEARGRPFGNLGLAAGQQSRYQADAAVFSLAGAIKIGLILNANNLGNDPIAQLPYESEAQTDVSSSRLVTPGIRPLMQVNRPLVADLPLQRFNFNQARLAGLTLNYQPTAKLAIKSYGYAVRDRHWFSSVVGQQYILNDSTIRVRDSTIALHQPSALSGQLQIDYTPNPGQLLRYVANGKISWAVQHRDLFSENRILPETIRFTGNETGRFGQHQLQFTHKIRAQQALVIHAFWSNNSLPQNGNWTSRRYADYVMLPAAFGQLTQEVWQQQQRGNINVRWQGAGMFSTFALSGGVLRSRERANGSLALQSYTSTVAFPDSGVSPDVSLQKTYLYTDGRYTFQKNKWKIQADGVLSYATARQTQPATPLNRRTWLVNGLASASYFLGRPGSLQVRYNRSQQLPDIYQTTGRYLLSDYRTFYRALPNLHIVTSNRYSLGYQQINNRRYLWSTVTLSYAQTRGPYLDQVAISNVLSFRTLQPEQYSVRQWLGMVQVDKLLTRLATKVRYEGLLAQSDLFTRLPGDVLRQSLYRSADNNLSLSTAFYGPVNAEVGSQFNQVTITTRSAGDIPAFRTQVVKPRFVLRYQPSPAWLIRLSGEQITWYNAGKPNGNTRFADIQVRYTPKQSKWQVEVQGLNLFNNQTLRFIDIGNVLISQQQFTLQPRYITLRIDRTL